MHAEVNAGINKSTADVRNGKVRALINGQGFGSEVEADRNNLGIVMSHIDMNQDPDNYVGDKTTRAETVAGTAFTLVQ